MDLLTLFADCSVGIFPISVRKLWFVSFLLIICKYFALLFKTSSICLLCLTANSKALIRKYTYIIIINFLEKNTGKINIKSHEYYYVTCNI